MSETRALLDKEVRARVNPQEADLIMMLADLHALDVGGGMVSEALTKLAKETGMRKMDTVAP